MEIKQEVRSSGAYITLSVLRMRFHPNAVGSFLRKINPGKGVKVDASGIYVGLDASLRLNTHTHRGSPRERPIGHHQKRGEGGGAATVDDDK